MTEIEVTADKLIIRMKGADQLWTLKSELEIPSAHVVGAEPAEAEASEWIHGLRIGGVHIPGVISAGTFYQNGSRVFWDVHDAQRAIAITLRDDRYSRIVVDVGDPASAIAAIESAIGR